MKLFRFIKTLFKKNVEKKNKKEVTVSTEKTVIINGKKYPVRINRNGRKFTIVKPKGGGKPYYKYL